MVRVTSLAFDEELLRRAKILAVQRDTTLRQIVTEALEVFLKAEGSSGKTHAAARPSARRKKK
jgi:predicted transcriptional regulator